LRATSRKHLSLQSAISYLGFGSPRRCAGDGDIGSRLCIPLEVAQVEVVGSQFHSTCQAHLIAKVRRAWIVAHARQHLGVGGQRPSRVKRDHEWHALTAVCVEQGRVLGVRSKRHGPHGFSRARFQDPCTDRVELSFVQRRIYGSAPDGKRVGGLVRYGERRRRQD